MQDEEQSVGLRSAASSDCRISPDPQVPTNESTGLPFEEQKCTALDKNAAVSKSEAAIQQNSPYQFSKCKKYFILLQITLATSLMPFTNTTVLPALPEMQESLNTTPTVANGIVAVTYFVYGAFPAIWATYGDGYGRRWIYIISLFISLIGNIGCAVSVNVPMLFLFRVISASGDSSLLSLNSGTLADVFTAKDRARVYAIISSVYITIPTFAPTVGGAIVASFGWRGVYWMLSILNGVAWILIFAFLPETRAPAAHSTPLRKRLLTNPFNSLKLLRYPNVLMIAIYCAIAMYSMNSIQTSFSWIYSNQYGFNTTTVGVCYLPGAVGGILGSIAMGIVSDFLYKRNQALCQRTNRQYYPEMRLNYVFTATAAFIGAAGYIAFGWLVQKNTFFAFGMMACFFGQLGSAMLGTVTAVYAADSFERKAASVSACLNIFRFVVGSVGTLTSHDFQTAVGAGIYGTICGFLILSAAAVIFPTVVSNASRWKNMRDRYLR